MRPCFRWWCLHIMIKDWCGAAPKGYFIKKEPSHRIIQNWTKPWLGQQLWFGNWWEIISRKRYCLAVWYLWETPIITTRKRKRGKYMMERNFNLRKNHSIFSLFRELGISHSKCQKPGPALWKIWRTQQRTYLQGGAGRVVGWIKFPGLIVQPQTGQRYTDLEEGVVSRVCSVFVGSSLTRPSCFFIANKRLREPELKKPK